ncbi:MAG TPA: hypothetical protein PLD27_02935 [bacterium]|nr:hypothetical protein [bacterium]HOL46964.1 hypothetical protein [bacterium]HPQ18229.1 hypothetical protein [bacterium]
MNKESGKIILILIIILLALIFGILYMLQKFGFVDVVGFVMPKIVKIPYIGKYFEPKIVTGSLLKEEELKLYEQSLLNKENQLKEKENELKGFEEKLKQKEKELEERENDIFLREQIEKKNKEEQTNKEKKLKELAFFYENMRPADAARKLEIMDPLLAAEILNRMKEKTTVSIILSKMSDEKSKDISRLMMKVE